MFVLVCTMQLVKTDSRKLAFNITLEFSKFAMHSNIFLCYDQNQKVQINCRHLLIYLWPRRKIDGGLYPAGQAKFVLVLSVFFIFQFINSRLILLVAFTYVVAQCTDFIVIVFVTRNFDDQILRFCTENVRLSGSVCLILY